MAAPLQEPVQLVVTANGNVWGLFIKCAREQTKGQFQLFVVRLEPCLLRKDSVITQSRPGGMAGALVLLWLIAVGAVL